MTRHAMLTLALGLALSALGTAPARAQSDCASDPNALAVYHAGSLNAAFAAVEQLFTQQTGVNRR